MRDYEIGLGVAPITFTKTDHRALSIARVYEYTQGEFKLLDTVDLQKRWPEKWAKEWIGW
jgi:branched-chain amino acid transport system substrate-binding protein